MGREKRYVSQAGEVFCTVCQSWKSLRDFRCHKLIGNGEDNPNDIWWQDPNNGREFGRPDGYCRACSSKKTQGPVAMRKYLEALGLDKVTWRDRWQAEQDKMDEEAALVWEPPTLDPTYAELELQRLEQMYGSGE
jgi:hypothetical protein